MTEPKKNPAAVALGRLGGKAGTGAAKRRTKAQHARMVAAATVARKEKRDCALEVLGALIDCEAAMALHPEFDKSAERARARAAIERATRRK